MTKGTSGTVEAFSYDPATKTQIIHFKSGDIYKYEGVPPEIHDQFVKDASQGSFHYNNIRGRYETTKIGKVAPTRTRGQQVSQALSNQPTAASRAASDAAFAKLHPNETMPAMSPDVESAWQSSAFGEKAPEDIGTQVRAKAPPIPRGGTK
jgi:hypothetical protein